MTVKPEDDIDWEKENININKDSAEYSSNSFNSDITKENEDLQPLAPVIIQTTPPCERELILVNETFLNWTERYAIPEVFYFTNNYTIKPHQSRIINISLSFEKNSNETKGGYFIISKDKGKSKEPFYWPKIEKKSGKLEKLTNMEIILESN